MKNFGMPYQGSKNRVAPKIVAALPPAENFVDLFFGGGAVTHAAMLSGKYTNFLANDLRKTPQAWNRLAEGDITDLFRFVSREEFKETDDMLVKMVWSFGADCSTYWSDAPTRLAIARAIMGGDPIERKGAILELMRLFDKVPANIYDKYHQAAGHFNSLKRLAAIKGLPTVACHNMDYREVAIPENSVVYCDPPYEGTRNYGNRFEHAEFWEWARTREFPVFVSGMSAPEDFVAVLEYTKQALFNKQSGWRKEGLFIHRRFA